jgi:hypothetical protein
MDVLEIRRQRLSTLLADFMICKSCGIVDRDFERMRIGYKCPRCGIPGDGAMAYFPISVDSLIDLMQEFYHLKQEAAPDSEAPVEQKASNHQLAVVIFFCALAEVLLQFFLEKRMSKMGLQHEIQERLLDDNLFVKQRVQKLFPALTSAKWNKAVEMLSKRVDLDYIETTKFYQRASSARNEFLHRGNKWAIPQDMPEQCIRHIWPLVCLFVALHNEYIAQPVDEDHV